jgi:DNA polymerase-1
MPPVLYLIDGHALAYRTYFALTAGAGSERLQTRSGEPTAGIFGFANVLMRLLEQEKPEYLAVAFDTGKTFRNEIFPDYKATRAKMPDDLRPQIERIRQLVDAFHLPVWKWRGWKPMISWVPLLIRLYAKVSASRSLPVTVTCCNW